MSRVSGIYGAFGTDLYRAPETFLRKQNTGKTRKNDIYSLSFTLADVINETPSGETLYGDELQQLNQYTVMSVKLEKVIPKFRVPKVCSDRDFKNVEDALTICLDGDPDKRMTIKDFCSVIDDFHNRCSNAHKDFDNNEGEPVPISQNVESPDKRNFLNFETKYCKCECTDLKISQATPNNMITFGNTENIDNSLLEVQHLKLLLKDQTRYTNLRRFEATNACAFYSALIMDTVLLSDDWTLQETIAKTRQIIMLSQLDFNQYRDAGQTYHIEDAIRILNKKLILNLRHYEELQHGLQFDPKDEQELLTTLASYFTKVKSVINMQHGFFYTIGDLTFSFAINYGEGIAMLIDSHQLPHIENGVVCNITMKNKESPDADTVLAEAVAMLLKKRIFESKQDSTYQLYHQVDFVMRDFSAEHETIPKHSQNNTERDNQCELPDFEVCEDYFRLDFSPNISLHEGSPTSNGTEYAPQHTSTPTEQVLREYQEEVFRQVNNYTDTLVIWPTGSGKSYTLLSIIEQSKEASIVVTPTLSLMMEYVKQLEKRNISYTHASSIEQKSSHSQIADICKRSPRCILTTHEQLLKWGMEGLSIIHASNGIGMICFDEIHCDMLWGVSFRPSMRQVHDLLEVIPSAVRIGLTATPMGGNVETTTKAVKLRNPYVARRSLFRSNINLNVFPNMDSKQSKYDMLWRKIGSAKKIIIFSSFVDPAEEIADFLRENTKLPIYTYTGVKAHKMKTEAFQDFESADAAIMVATAALGKSHLIWIREALSLLTG